MMFLLFFVEREKVFRKSAVRSSPSGSTYFGLGLLM